jgi:HrpA-like RNA helicase
LAQPFRLDADLLCARVQAKAVLAQSVQPPDLSSVDAALTRLASLGALAAATDATDVTPFGRLLAAFPADLALGRLVAFGAIAGVLADAIVMAASASVADGVLTYVRTVKIVDNEPLDGWFTEDFTWDELATLRCRERLSDVRLESRAFDGQFELLRLTDLLRLVDSYNCAKISLSASWIVLEKGMSDTRDSHCMRDAGAVVLELLDHTNGRYVFALCLNTFILALLKRPSSLLARGLAFHSRQVKKSACDSR